MTRFSKPAKRLQLARLEKELSGVLQDVRDAQVRYAGYPCYPCYLGALGDVEADLVEAVARVANARGQLAP